MDDFSEATTWAGRGLTDEATDAQLAAWLDAAALPLRQRRRFAADCRHYRQTREADSPTPHTAAADFARHWLKQHGAPVTFRRDPTRDDSLSHAPAHASPDAGPYAAARVAAVRLWLTDPDHHLPTLLDAGYPSRLFHLEDPPPLLYVRGDLAWLHKPLIAVVGSRRASAQGQESAAYLASELALRGWSIVSGLAQGIDAAAHRAALTRAAQAKTHAPRAEASPQELASVAHAPLSASTVAVIGTGIDQVYPACHVALCAAIGRTGAVLSEWPLGTAPKPAHFPQRNRLIAALSHGVVVVEAALRSGSLITARLANELGREVFALPGSIFAPQARGCHALIKEGATLVECVEDIIDGLPPRADTLADAQAVAHDLAERRAPPRHDGSGISPSRSPPTPTSPQTSHRPDRPGAPAREPPPPDRRVRPSRPDEPVMNALGHDTVALDILCARTGLPAAVVAARLASYEIDGLVGSTGGRFFRLPASGLAPPRAAGRRPAPIGGPLRPVDPGAMQAPTGNVVESAADSAPRQTETDERVIRPGQS